jgi:hypothetical protein
MNDTDVNAIVVVSCDEQVAREVRRGRARVFGTVEMKKVRRTGGI